MSTGYDAVGNLTRVTDELNRATTYGYDALDRRTRIEPPLGTAYATDHPAQRVYREALVFSVAGQTTAVMEASLARLLPTLA